MCQHPEPSSGLLESVRRRLVELNAGYLETPLMGADIDRYVVPPALGDQAARVVVDEARLTAASALLGATLLLLHPGGLARAEHGQRAGEERADHGGSLLC